MIIEPHFKQKIRGKRLSFPTRKFRNPERNLKDSIPFFPRDAKEFRPDIKTLVGKVVLPTYRSALEEINRWLVSIPLDQRAFDMQQYQIRKK